MSSYATKYDLRIMSWNLLSVRIVSAETDHPWVDRKEHIYLVIEKNDPDVMGFQEMYENRDRKAPNWEIRQNLPDQYKFMKDKGLLGSYSENNGKYHCRITGDRAIPIYYANRWLGNTRNKFWKGKKAKEELGSQEDEECVGGTFQLHEGGYGGSRHHRYCTWAKFRIKGSHHYFFVYNTHFSHLEDAHDAREKVSDVILERVKENVRKGFPVIVMGDFNVREEWGQSAVSLSRTGLFVTPEMIFSRTTIPTTSARSMVGVRIGGNGDDLIIFWFPVIFG